MNILNLFRPKSQEEEITTTNLNSNDSSSLTVQQDLTLQQSQQTLDIIIQANRALDEKSSTLVQAGSLIIALVSVFNIPGFIATNPVDAEWWAIGSAFASFIGLVILSTLAWAPKEYVLPGSSDWHETYTKLLQVDIEDSFNQVLINYLNAITKSQKLNDRKSGLVNWSAALLIIQVGSLMVAALIK